MFGFAKKLVSSIESQLSTEVSQRDDASLVDESRQALRILSVTPNSIAFRHGLESWFDFIVAMNGTDIRAYLELNTESGYVGYENMMNYIRHEVEVSNSDITMTVFSSKGSVLRDITISSTEIQNAIAESVPPLEEISLSTDADQGDNTTGQQWSPNLGASFQLTPIRTGFFTWHVLRVHPGSPAYLAGIMPDEYIIQSQDGLLATGGEDLLAKVLQSQYAKSGDGCEVVLYVYNYDSDCVRPARVILNSGSIWGGRGILGCDVGYGLLHRVPEVVGKFQTNKSVNQVLPESTQDAFDEKSAPLKQPPEFLPLRVAAPNFLSDNVEETVDQAAKSVVSNPNRKRGQNTGLKHPNVDLNAYFDEQTKLSKDADVGNSPLPKSDSSIPPPPQSAKKA